MIEETIKLNLEPEGTAEVEEALKALDQLEKRTKTLTAPKELRKFTADATAVAGVKPPLHPRPDGLRPDLAPKPGLDPFRSGKRLAGIPPALVPVIAAFFTPSIIGATANRYLPGTKGAADKYFFKAQDRRLNEWLLGTGPGFLYGTSRTMIDKARFPGGRPTPPPPPDPTKSAPWRKMKGWGADPLEGYPRIYYDSEVFKRQRDEQLRNPWGKHEFWAKKRYKRWRREPDGARQTRRNGTPEQPRELRIPQTPTFEFVKGKPLLPPPPPAYNPFTDPNYESKVRLYSAYPTPTYSMSSSIRPPGTDWANIRNRQPGAHHVAYPPPPSPPRHFLFESPRAAPGTDWEKLWATGEPPSKGPHVGYPPPEIPPFPKYEFPKRPEREPDIPPRGLQAPTQRSQPGARNIYNIQIDRIANTITADTVDEESIMKLIGKVVKTELPS